MTETEMYARILDAAAELFSTRGYEAVTLRDIGNAVSIRHASLYHYAPKGKIGHGSQLSAAQAWHHTCHRTC